jgi:topoisomerase IV subunit A
MPAIAPTGEIRDVDFAEALGERYLSYALSTIMSRSLPDVRDGLKPVHRRILHAMQQLRLDPASGYKKCARVVGDVIGKFHPHGELAVYDALVRLAQDFSQRYPLIDGQGNFGNIDGDNAAAMRYTESRLSAVAQAMLDGIDENTVDFRPTYDGEDSEPARPLPEPAGERSRGDCRRHGNQHPAAQRRRAVRGTAASDRRA